MTHRRARPGARAWPFLLAGLFLLAWGVANWRAVPAGVWHDDGVYMVVGEALANGQGLTYGGVPGAPPAVKFPPGYSTLLALLWFVLPGPGAVTLAATLLNLVFLASAGSALGWGLHRFAGLPPVPAASLGAGAFLATDVWRLALVPLSEPLFIMLGVGAMVVAGGAIRPGSSRRECAALAALLVATLMVRSAGLAVVGGVAAAYVAKGRFRAGLVAVAPAVAAHGAWSLWASAGARRLSPEAADVLGPYGSWLGGQLLDAPAAFFGALPAHGAAVSTRVASLLVPDAPPWLALVSGLVLLAVALGGAVRLHREWPAIPWVAGAYVVMLIVWPFSDRRLVAPLHPLLVAMIGVGAWHWRPTGYTAGRSWARTRFALVGVVALWAAGHVVVSANRAAREWTVAPYRLRAERLALAVEALQRVAPPEAIVGAPEFWPALHLHGGWRTTPSALFRPRSDDEETPVWGAPDDQMRLWWDAGVTHLLLEQGGLIHTDALTRLEDACPGTVTIPARFPPQMVVSIAWDPVCAGSLGLADRSR